MIKPSLWPQIEFYSPGGQESWHLPWFAAAAKLPQLGLTLCDPIDSSPPGSSVSGILQTKTVEWVAISFSNACMCQASVCPSVLSRHNKDLK